MSPALLSPRQLRLLQARADGYSPSRAAALLGVSRDTVYDDRRAMLATLDARDWAHAVRRGFEAGILH